MEPEKQKQVQEGGNPTLSVKLSQEMYELVNILADELAHGTNGNDLLKMFIQSFIEAAKHVGPLTADMRLLLNMLKIDPAWHKAYNFADVTATNDIAQMILVLQQHDNRGPRHGFGLVMIDKPFCGEPHMTYCLDDILERVTEIAMRGLYKQLREIGQQLDTTSLRETLITMCDAQERLNADEADRELMPKLGDTHDYGRRVQYGKKYKRVPHRTPDSLANQQPNLFDEGKAMEQALGFKPFTCEP